MSIEREESARNEPAAYFRRVVGGYSKGDVEDLLNKCRRAGPLLQVVMNGIDLIGGMCYGFKSAPSNVGERSITFMKEYMGIAASWAEALYTCVRCGITHQGVPSIGFVYFAPSDGQGNRRILTKGPDSQLLLNVCEFARIYLQAIASIEKNPEKHIKYTPCLHNRDKRSFGVALSQVPSADEGTLAILGIASYSAYSPNWEADWFMVKGAREVDDTKLWR